MRIKRIIPGTPHLVYDHGDGHPAKTEAVLPRPGLPTPVRNESFWGDELRGKKGRRLVWSA